MVGVWWVGVWCMYVWWITTVLIIRPSQPSLAGVGAGAELGNYILFAIICSAMGGPTLQVG